MRQSRAQSASSIYWRAEIMIKELHAELKKHAYFYSTNAEYRTLFDDAVSGFAAESAGKIKVTRDLLAEKLQQINAQSKEFESLILRRVK